jgi:glycosyltransferase involved in cell wall biosynthesis
MLQQPTVTIVVPTHNRVGSLLQTVGSLLKQDYESYEVLVVDNNCSDDTGEQVAALAAQDARLRYVRETRPGLTAARECGGNEGRGKLIAYVDDDELAPPDWLGKLVRLQQETGAAGVGGPYEPLWLAPPPSWLLNSSAMRETLTFFDFGPSRSAVEWLLGGNALYTRESLEAVSYYGGYDAGTRSKGMIGGEDILMGSRMRAAGYELWYEPTASVAHQVPPERMRLSYILRRAFWAGYTDVAIGQKWNLTHKSAKALRRGWDAIALGLAILPGTLYGRFHVATGRLVPANADWQPSPPFPPPASGAG